MRYYEDIGIEQMSHDFERVREYLRIERWLVLRALRTVACLARFFADLILATAGS